MSNPALPDYVLGRSPEEYARLTLQARILRPYTERFFRAAGISEGMHVLDLGSGMGDVAMLAGDIVGPAGRVLGIDMDAAVLENARQRAAGYGCAPWVSFEQASITEFASPRQFDALVGRYVLLYLPDPGAALGHLLTNLKPGGIVVFHDVDLMDTNRSEPPCRLWDQACQALRDTLGRSGSPLDAGRRLGSIFLRAGLPFPTIVMEASVGGGPRSSLYPWVASTVASVAPRMAALGLELAPGLAPLETLAVRLEEEAVRQGAQLIGPYQYGAWARKRA